MPSSRSAATSTALAVLLLGGLFSSQVCRATEASAWLPVAPAPESQWGGAFEGEFDARDVDQTAVEVRRIIFKLGYSPAANLSFWGEGGVAALTVEESGGDMLQGDFGADAGVGFTAALRDFLSGDLAPFVMGRGTLFVSRIADDRTLQGVQRSRRSRFEWREFSGMGGFYKQFSGGHLFAGLVARALFQEESRNIRSNNTRSSDDFSYDSGIEAGVGGGIFWTLPFRLSLRVAGEVYSNSGKVTLSFGQWGAPIRN